MIIMPFYQNINKEMQLCTKIRPLILVGCSGAGRSAIIYRLTRNLPHKFERLISYTTRKPRASEKDGRDFYFVTEDWIQKNKQMFVTLTYSENNNYYGLTSEEVARVMGKRRIPVLKMTLDAYINNIGKSCGITQNAGQSQSVSAKDNAQPAAESNPQSQSKERLYLLRNKNMQCQALYTTLPSLAELERRLKFSPFSLKQQAQKIDKAKKEHGRVEKYFPRENIVGKYFDGPQGQVDEDFEDTIMRVYSRLFEIY